jgi:hypothetical protein
VNFWPFRKPQPDPHGRHCGIRTSGLCDCGALDVPPDPDWKPASVVPLRSVSATVASRRAREDLIMKGAEWHAFQSQRVEAAGDHLESRLHLQDAAEYLTQVGGPNHVQSAEEIYQYCAARRAGER